MHTKISQMDHFIDENNLKMVIFVNKNLQNDQTPFSEGAEEVVILLFGSRNIKPKHIHIKFLLYH